MNVTRDKDEICLSEVEEGSTNNDLLWRFRIHDDVIDNTKI